MRQEVPLYRSAKLVVPVELLPVVELVPLVDIIELSEVLLIAALQSYPERCTAGMIMTVMLIPICDDV